MDEKKSNKRQITKVLILVVALMVIAFSGTYAYFTNNFIGSPSTTSATSGIFKVESSLEKTSAIHNTNLTLISEEEKEIRAEKLTFTVTSTEESTVDGEFNIYLKDIKLSKNLYSKYLKWELLKENEIISQGDFENAVRVDTVNEGEKDNVVTDVEAIQLNTVALKLPKDSTQTFVFRMYLQNDKFRNQVDLTAGSFNGRLYIEAIPVSELNPNA